MHKEIIEVLSYAHRVMERVLTLLRLQVDILRDPKNAEGIQLLVNAVGYMQKCPGLIHHPAEEMMFARLTRRAPRAGEACARLAAQHREFDRQETAILVRLEETRSRGDLGVLRRTVARYCTAHADHFRSEEEDVFPQAEEHLSEEDWREIRDTARLELDPLGDLSVLKRYGSLYDYFMAGDQSFRLH